MTVLPPGEIIYSRISMWTRVMIDDRWYSPRFYYVNGSFYSMKLLSANPIALPMTLGYSNGTKSNFQRLIFMNT
jgi:hypothetical protein